MIEPSGRYIPKAGSSISPHASSRLEVWNDFRGGINRSVSPDLIDAADVVDAVNVTYQPAAGGLTLRPGLQQVYAGGTGMYAPTQFLPGGDRLFVLSNGGYEPGDVYGSKLYEFKNGGLTHLGKVSGGGAYYDPWPASIARWDGGYVIASGIRLDYLKDNTITRCEAAYDSSFVAVKSGRVIITNPDRGKLFFSGIGNWQDWQFEDAPGSNWTDRHAVELEVGYKDGAVISHVGHFAGGMLVFKGSGVYLVSGDYPNWAVKQVISEKGETICPVITPGDAFWVADGRIRQYNASAPLGTVANLGVGEKLGSMTWKTTGNRRFEQAKCWHLPRRAQVWYRPGGFSSRDIYVLHLKEMAWTRYVFQQNVTDVCEHLGDIHVLSSNYPTGLGIPFRIYKMVDGVTADEGLPFSASVTLRPLDLPGDVVVTRMGYSFSGCPALSNATVTLTLGSETLTRNTIYTVAGSPQLRPDGEKRVNRRFRRLEPSISWTGGQLALSSVQVAYAQV